MKPTLMIPFESFKSNDLVVRTEENHRNDNRIYRVLYQHGNNHYVGRTEIVSIHDNMQLMIDSLNLRPATTVEQLASCRLLGDNDINIEIDKPLVLE